MCQNGALKRRLEGTGHLGKSTHHQRDESGQGRLHLRGEPGPLKVTRVQKISNIF